MHLADSFIQADVLTRAPCPSLEAATGVWWLPTWALAIDHHITRAPLFYYNTSGFNYCTQPESRPLLQLVWPQKGLCFSAPCCQSNVELQVEIRFTFGTRAYCTDSNGLDLCACCHNAVSWSSTQEFIKNVDCRLKNNNATRNKTGLLSLPSSG